jgi:hypothetical protein
MKNPTAVIFLALAISCLFSAVVLAIINNIDDPNS